jgi:prepilin signal peptidase PulO-like enzyme (type II secretory pathway)
LSLYAWLLLLVLLVDLQQRLVYNVILVPAAAMAVIASIALPQPGLASALAGGLVGFTLLGVVALAYPPGLGKGDVKLAGVIGLMTGFPNVLLALTLGVLAGGLAAALLLITRVVDRKSYIPYAPFLVLGAIVALIHGADILNWYLVYLRG